MKLKNINGFDRTTGEPNINPALVKQDLFFRGGTRGKKEYRKSVTDVTVLGRNGSNTLFRGSCWNCDSTHIGTRRQNRKSLCQCRNCGETSFMVKGLFNDENRYPVSEYSVLKPNELTEDMYVVINTYKNLNPTVCFWTEQEYHTKQQDEVYSVDLQRIIESE